MARLGRRFVSGPRSADISISRFVVACTLKKKDDIRLAFSESNQRGLFSRVNRSMLVLEGLTAPLPGCTARRQA